MVWHILIEQQSEQDYRATILEWSECTAEGVTRQEALERLRHTLAMRLSQGEIVTLDTEEYFLELPASAYARLQALAEAEHTGPTNLITRWIAEASQQTEPPTSQATVQALLDTGLVGHMRHELGNATTNNYERQPPPTLPGPSVSDILIAQRRGEM